MSIEIVEELSVAEIRFEAWRRRSGVLLAPLTFMAMWLAPWDLPVAAHRLAAILATVVILWITEAIPMAMTAFLGVAFSVLLGVAPAAEAFAPFADPLIFLFIGTFILAQSIYFHGLDRRFAFAILGSRAVGESPARLLAAYAAAAAAISMWISNTATTAMMFPIGISLLKYLDSGSTNSRVSPGFAAALLLSTSFGASIGGLATPVGTPPNLIGIGFLRRELGFDMSFFTWMLLGLPVVLLLTAIAIFDLARSGASHVPPLVGLSTLVAKEKASHGSWTRGQINTLIAFGTTIFLWILPGVLALILGQEHPAYRQISTTLPESVVALLGAGLLFVLPIDLGRHEFTLSWNEAVKIDWWIVFLYGGGIALGTLTFKTGLAHAMGTGLTHFLGVKSEFALLALSTGLATILSETTSNTASANMVVPVVIAFAQSAGIDPIIPAIGATMGASLGFMLPVSTPCNAIVYGSGRIPILRMLRHGIVLDIAGVLTIIAILSTLGPIILGH